MKPVRPIAAKHARIVRAAAIALAAFLAPVVAQQAAGTAPSAREMMEKNFYVSRIKALKSEATMVLINDKDQRRERRTTTYSALQPNGIDSKLLVKFTTPADIKGTAFLEVEHLDGDDDEWIFLPALGKSRRLVANNKKDSFVGSDFSYGDLSLPKVDLFEHRLLESETIDAQDCQKIESVPKSESTKADLGYSRKITWLRKDNFLETKVEYYDANDRLLKVQRVGGHQLLEPDTKRWLARHREMTNQQTGHRTVFDFDQVESGITIPDDTFTTRYLERE